MLSGSGVVEKIPANGATPLAGTTGGGATSVQVSGSPGTIFRYYTAGVGITNYELDLFGASAASRVKHSSSIY